MATENAILNLVGHAEAALDRIENMVTARGRLCRFTQYVANDDAADTSGPELVVRAEFIAAVVPGPSGMWTQVELQSGTTLVVRDAYDDVVRAWVSG